MFTKNRLPKYPVLMSVVESLMPMAPGLNQQEVKRWFELLWTDADAEEAAQADTSAQQRAAPVVNDRDTDVDDIDEPSLPRDHWLAEPGTSSVRVGLTSERYFTRHTKATSKGWTPAPLQNHLRRLVESTGMSATEAESEVYVALGGTRPHEYMTPNFLRKALMEKDAFPTKDLVEAVINLSTANGHEANKTREMWCDFRPDDG
jgi:hypothetical protein